jgi:uncharacterized membrane protein
LPGPCGRRSIACMNDRIGFWGLFWLLVIFVPIGLVWIAAMLDLFHRADLTGVAKAGWLLVVLVLPIVGTLIYLIVRPRAVEQGHRHVDPERAAREAAAIQREREAVEDLEAQELPERLNPR